MTAEGDWRDLYNGIKEVLGTDRADTLMSRISLHPYEELAKRSDIDALATRTDLRFEQVDARFEQIDARFEQVDARFDQIDKRFELVDRRFDTLEAAVTRLQDRLDRLQLTLIGGLLAVIAAVIIQTIFG